NVALPAYRNLYKHIKADLPKKGRAKQKQKDGGLDPETLPAHLQGALQALYGHYQQIFAEWEKIGRGAPPVFIVVCNNTSTSKLVYDHIAGYEVTEGEITKLKPGALPLFSNVGDGGMWLTRPRALLIDTEQVVRRGLRSVSDEVDASGFYEPEDAKLLAIPHAFVASNVKAVLRPPRPQTRIYSPPERAALELRFPCVTGYRLLLPQGRLTE